MIGDGNPVVLRVIGHEYDMAASLMHDSVAEILDEDLHDGASAQVPR